MHSVDFEMRDFFTSVKQSNVLFRLVTISDSFRIFAKLTRIGEIRRNCVFFKSEIRFLFFVHYVVTQEVKKYWRSCNKSLLLFQHDRILFLEECEDVLKQIQDSYPESVWKERKEAPTKSFQMSKPLPKRKATNYGPL